MAGQDVLAELKDFIISAQTEITSTKASITADIKANTFENYTKSVAINIPKALKEASDEITQLSRTAVYQNITSSIWSWPRVTLRRNGSSASSPRDIVDTGELLNSSYVKQSYNVKSAKISIINSAPHAGLVHYGGYARGASGGRSYMPPRPFASAVIGQTVGGLGVIPSGAAVVPYKKIVAEALIRAIENARGG